MCKKEKEFKNEFGGLRMKKEIYGEVFKLKEFIEDCEAGYFIDSDGYGYLIFDDEIESKKIVYPSDILKGNYEKGAKYVRWLNK